MKRLARVAAALAVLLPAAAGGAASAVASPEARLEGTFAMAGRVTAADNVAGEHTGQRIKRTWRFVPGCAAGVCRSITLERTRVFGRHNSLALTRHAPGYYVGHGHFYAPLRCGSRVYRPGELVKFTIAVRIAAKAVFGGRLLATQVRAGYGDDSRQNLTACVAFLGHDAARYTGRLVSAG